MSSIIIKGGSLFGEKVEDLAVSNGKIVEPSSVGSDTVVIDAANCIVLPGLVDLHTHLREPGRENAETVLSGSRAGIKGGFTALSAMANTLPVADNAGVVEQVWRLGQATGLCDVFPIGAVTEGLEGKNLAEIGAMADSEARVRVFSDDGNCVSDSLVMRRALEYVKKFNGVIAQHAQDPRLTVGAQMNEGEVSSQLGLKGWPTIAEEAIIARDILLADHVGSRLHICHLTSAGGVELVRWAKARGIAVTAEVTPHHLLLTDELARSYDPIYKVNPPLRRASDVQALREGLADGTIDIIATDHAPHPSESKECEWQEASFGMLGLESALAIANMVLVETGLLTWRGIAQKLSINPAAIAGYGDHGSDLSVGKTANITIIDPKREWRVDRDLVQSRSKNTPYHGMQMRGVARDVIYRGSVVLRNGEVHNG